MSTVIQMMLAPTSKVRERRAADDWLRSSTGAFIPEKYAKRAEELSSSKHRLMLAKTLRKIERVTDERVLGRPTILDLAAVRAHRSELRSLVTLLEDEGNRLRPRGCCGSST